jgi:hypothetical protein
MHSIPFFAIWQRKYGTSLGKYKVIKVFCELPEKVMSFHTTIHITRANDS